MILRFLANRSNVPVDLSHDSPLFWINGAGKSSESDPGYVRDNTESDIYHTILTPT